MRLASQLRQASKCWFLAAISIAFALTGACASYDPDRLPEPAGHAGDGVPGAGSGGSGASPDGGGVPLGDAGGVCGEPDDPDNCGASGNVC